MMFQLGEVPGQLLRYLAQESCARRAAVRGDSDKRLQWKFSRTTGRRGLPETKSCGGVRMTSFRFFEPHELEQQGKWSHRRSARGC